MWCSTSVDFFHATIKETKKNKFIGKIDDVASVNVDYQDNMLQKDLQKSFPHCYIADILMAVQCHILNFTEHNFTYFCPLNFSSFFLDARNVVEALSFAVWYFLTFLFLFFEHYIIGIICWSMNYLSYNLHDAFRNI